MPGSWTPTHHEHLVQRACWMPFTRAAVLLERLLGVQVGAATVRRLTEAAGAILEQIQTVESQRIPDREEPPLLVTSEASKLVLSADGA
jgi:hypothetical protein